jgi:hypothetical protein
VLEVLGDGARADVGRPGDGQVGPAPGGHLQDLKLTIGELAQGIGLGRDGGPGIAPSARPSQRVAHRRHDRAQQRGIGRAELPVRPAQRDADQLAVLRARHGERNLVVGRDVAEVLAVDAQLPESLTADHVADPGGPAAPGGQLVLYQRVLAHVGLKDRHGGRVQAGRWIFGVMTEPIRLGTHFLVCSDITADQTGQAGQYEVGRSVRLVQVCEAVGKLQRSVERVQ